MMRTTKLKTMMLAVTGMLSMGPIGAQTHRLTAEDAEDGYARPRFQLYSNPDFSALATTGPTGLSPAAVRHFYGHDLITNTGSGQIIAIVTAFDSPNAEKDLGTFSTNYKLTACTTANGCFKKIYAAGTVPPVDATWALETALDVQWAHAIAPAAKIYLVEAKSSSNTDLLAAVDVAVSNGANVVSMSFGGAEYAAQINDDVHFNKLNITFVAASGDTGYGAEYPSSSPYVLAVGGTTVVLGTGNVYGSETAWSGSSGGQSKYDLIPAYQSGLPVPSSNGYRAIPDVSFDANPASGFAVYDSTAYGGATGWFQVGGTSAGAPQWAGLAAIVNSMRLAAGKKVLGATATSRINNLIYLLGATATYANNYHDVTSGTNGTCGTLCTAVTKYDYVTGLGTPKANTLINSLVAQP